MSLGSVQKFAIVAENNELAIVSGCSRLEPMCHGHGIFISCFGPSSPFFFVYERFAFDIKLSLAFVTSGRQGLGLFVYNKYGQMKETLSAAHKSEVPDMESP